MNKGFLRLSVSARGFILYLHSSDLVLPQMAISSAQHTIPVKVVPMVGQTCHSCASNRELLMSILNRSGDTPLPCMVPWAIVNSGRAVLGNSLCIARPGTSPVVHYRGLQASLKGQVCRRGHDGILYREPSQCQEKSVTSSPQSECSIIVSITVRAVKIGETPDVKPLCR